MKTVNKENIHNDGADTEGKKFGFRVFSRARIQRLVLIVICVVVALAAPCFWLFADNPDFIGLEKRYRSGWPEFSSRLFLSGRWGERVETWMTDRMPAREFFVGVDSYVWYMSGRQAARDVFVDKRGNLVDAPFEYDRDELYKRLDKAMELTEIFQSVQSKFVEDQKQVDGAAQLMPAEGFEDAIQQTDGALLQTQTDGAPPPSQPPPPPVSVILAPPGAGYAAPLPPRLKRLYRFDDIAGDIITYTNETNSKNNANIQYVDLRRQITGSGAVLYYRTDHHWNAEGVYTAYTALGDTLGYTPLPKSSFTVEPHDGFYGSVYAKSGLWLTGPDTIELWSQPRAHPLRVTVINESQPPEERDNLFYTEFLTGWDMYSVFLGGIQGITVVDNPEAVGAGCLFVVKDSYANSLIPLLAPHFCRIVVIDPRRCGGPIGEIFSEYGDSGGDNKLLFVYSMSHLIGDHDLLKLR